MYRKEKYKQNSIQHKKQPNVILHFLLFYRATKNYFGHNKQQTRKLLTKTVSFTRKKPLLELLLSFAATSPKHTHATNHIVCRVDVLFTVYCVQTSIFTVPRPAIIKRTSRLDNSDGNCFRASEIYGFWKLYPQFKSQRIKNFILPNFGVLLMIF